MVQWSWRHGKARKPQVLIDIVQALDRKLRGEKLVVIRSCNKEIAGGGSIDDGTQVF
jgi:hypothetical protein